MASNKRVNILVYSGVGSTVESVKHCIWSLRRLLSPNYAVIPVTGEAILKEPWTTSCALLVFPGGGDLGYCRTLNGEGNRRISQYVNRGGNYIGFCAGGYYGCKRCEFEVGNKSLEVVGNRELSFFPDTCRGLAFDGFIYHSEAGAKAAEVQINKEAFPTGAAALPEVFRCYYNGGGVFVDADKYKSRGVEVLARYTEKLHVDGGEGAAAAVYCKVGDGAAILTGPHPEFSAVNLNKTDNGPEYAKVVEALQEDDKQRTDFLKACLSKLGLEVNQQAQAVPSLSRLHLSAKDVSDVAELVSTWKEIITVEDGEEYIKCQNDTFHLEKPSAWSMASLTKAVSKVAGTLTDLTVGTNKESAMGHSDSDDSDMTIDYNAVTKRLITHETELPSAKETPYFNHHAFFGNLTNYNTQSHDSSGEFGQYLLYGEVVTSTNTLLEKNPSLLHTLPTGFTATATTQLAGRGRGNNVWVSPPGSLMFSTVIKHPLSLTQRAPVVFIQYLVALAVVEGIQKYDRQSGYTELDVKLKWPNDIYAADPTAPAGSKAYVKIGGILVNSNYNGKEYELVVGVGINVSNAAPTTSLNALASKAKLPPFTLEKILASILVRFEALYVHFCSHGWDRTLEGQYYDNWLHMDQIVTLEAEGGARARIKGITRDWGLLLAEELGWEDRRTGKVWQLQSDSNSFDFFKGLVKRKV